MMSSEKKLKCLKYTTVLGCVLLLLPNGFYWYWGNLSVYSLSYMIIVHESTSSVGAPWVLSAFVIMWTAALLMSGIFVGRINQRYTILLGIAISDIGIFCSYFTVQHSLSLLTFTIGAILGYGTGLIDGCTLHMAVEWADDDVGRITALIQGTFGISGVVINEFITYFINPNNLSPDVELMKGTKYFSQKVLLDQVPDMFFVLGCFAVCSHVIGFLMLRDRPKDEAKRLLGETSVQPEAYSLEKREGEVDNKERKSGARHDATIVKNGTSSQKSKRKKQQRDFTPWEVLKSKAFYGMWISFFFGDMPFVILTNYYKLYGQLWIADDHFLTSLGTTLTLLSAFSNLLWGVLIDRYGVKNCLIFFGASLTIIQCWYYFTPMIDKWVFFVYTVIYGCFAGSLFACYTAAVAVAFGKKHFSTNLGLIMTSSLIFNMVAPPMLQIVLSLLEWYALFALGSGLILFGLISLIILSPSLI